MVEKTEWMIKMAKTKTKNEKRNYKQTKTKKMEKTNKQKQKCMIKKQNKKTLTSYAWRKE